MQDKPQASEVRSSLDRLARRDIRQVALIAFVVGVLFHACVIYAVLGSGGGGSSSASASTASPASSSPSVQITPVAPLTPTALPDRTDCAQIRDTAYRSPTERTWFLAHCTTG